MNRFDGRGEIGMKVLNKKASNLEGVEWTHDLFKFSSPKSPLKVTARHGCHRHFELPKRIGGLSGHGGSTGSRQMSVLAAQRPGD